MAKRSFLRDNGLSLVLLALFGIFTACLGLVGWKEYNSEQARHGQPEVTLGQYLGSAEFGEAVFENWESEFLQMGLYVILTAMLFQRGSSESRDPDEVDEPSRARADSPGPVKRGGWRLALYRNSLSLAFVALFLVSFVGHALCGLGAANSEAIVHGEPPMSLWSYVSGSRFWFESFQNWQSEFLAVLAIVVLSIWLRQEGSPESKPLGAPHSETGGG
jgi:hypothetical protein